ncbi:helix-turn-helix domain-containing protein [Lysinibacillus odysseyi]|uniref:XRE family transcriptional regulator n=1 Tax=Lysinibacillus odysseyi 34hs-1 = NBRC 100172 TaxID=1220589 RepID=A0A0A3IIB6_9BACI|nr:helix-turn-helix transcriptional regulator [Lysinibacillus odysseyi]KGR82568.1 XRE family transcriptional regulator [Lysinibacillus odysseyi 34hs-1 = NBRC 100172]
MKIVLHELLKQLREERNWSLEDLSLKTQVGVEKLAMYEKGELTPSIQTILKLSTVLEVPASNLMDTVEK